MRLKIEGKSDTRTKTVLVSVFGHDEDKPLSYQRTETIHGGDKPSHTRVMWYEWKNGRRCVVPGVGFKMLEGGFQQITQEGQVVDLPIPKPHG